MMAKRQRATGGKPARGGRPTSFRREYVDIAAAMVKNGASDADLAAAFRVSISTIWRWQAKHEEFCAVLAVPYGRPDDRAERSLYQRAIGYTYDAEKIFQHDGKPVRVPYQEHVPPDANAAMRWLTNRRGDKWSYRQTHEVTGKDGKDLVPESASHRDLARAVLDILREAELAPTQDAPVDEADAVEDARGDDDVASTDVHHRTPRTEEALKTARHIDVSEASPPARRVRVFNPQTGRLE